MLNVISIKLFKFIIIFNAYAMKRKFLYKSLFHFYVYKKFSSTTRIITRMFLASIYICVMTMIIFVHVNTMPSSFLEQINGELDPNEMQEIFQGKNYFPTSFYKRNSPLCDYRLQFRPLPLTSALCGYGMFEFVYNDFVKFDWIHF